jgi:hypothetical protein
MTERAHVNMLVNGLGTTTMTNLRRIRTFWNYKPGAKTAIVVKFIIACTWKPCTRLG